MKDNHKTLMKISLSLMIVGAGYIKSATTAELRSVGSSEPTASNAETAGDVCQTVNIILRNFAGDELGSYTVGRNDTLAELNKNGYFLLPGTPAKLDQSRTIGNILREQDPTGQYDVLTLEYVPSPTFRLDLSRLNKNALQQTYPEATSRYKEENITYTEKLLGLHEYSGREMRFLSWTDYEGNLNLYITNGSNFESIYIQPDQSTGLPTAVYGTTDPSNFKDIAAGQDTPQFFKTILNPEGAGKGEAGNKVYLVKEPTADKPFGYILYKYDNNTYRCTYSENGEYVVISLPRPTYTHPPIVQGPTPPPIREEGEIGPRLTQHS